MVGLAMIVVGAFTLFTGLAIARALSAAFAFIKRLILLNVALIAVDLPLALLFGVRLLFDPQSNMLSLAYPFVPTLSPILHIPCIFSRLDYETCVLWLQTNAWKATYYGLASVGTFAGSLLLVLRWVERRIEALCSVCGAPMELKLADLGRKKACPACGAYYKIKPDSAWDLKSVGLKIGALIVCLVTWGMVINHPEELESFYDSGIIILTFGIILMDVVWAADFGRLSSLIFPVGIIPAWIICGCEFHLLGLLAIVATLALAWLCYLMTHLFLLARVLDRSRKRYIQGFVVLAPLTTLCSTGTQCLGPTGLVFLFVTFFLCLPLFTLGVDQVAKRKGLVETHHHSYTDYHTTGNLNMSFRHLF